MPKISEKDVKEFAKGYNDGLHKPFNAEVRRQYKKSVMYRNGYNQGEKDYPNQ